MLIDSIVVYDQALYFLRQEYFRCRDLNWVEENFSATLAVEETKKRRDPILFGLIKGSNKLYYVTDWIDEFCDLTLDKFVETLQIDKNALKLPETINVE